MLSVDLRVIGCTVLSILLLFNSLLCGFALMALIAVKVLSRLNVCFHLLLNRGGGSGFASRQTRRIAGPVDLAAVAQLHSPYS